MAHADPIVVTLSRDMEDLVPLFLSQRKIDLATLAAALPASDFQAIRKVGHGMTGAGASYGFDHLSHLGEQLEQAARAADAVTVGRLKREFESYMARLSVQYG
jgi:HPt (histidine-containing phosphotransfer) domain-containing protein